MPIIVDKRKGQRSVHIVNNKPNIMEDLIQALRGLNFKFEVNVKILDVTKDEPTGEELKRKVSETSRPTPIPDTQTQTQQQEFLVSNITDKPNEKLDYHQDLLTSSPPLNQPAPVQAEPKPERVEAQVLSPQPQPTPPPTPQQPRPVDPMPEQPNIEPVRQPIKYSRADILLAARRQSPSPVKQQEAIETPRLIKGSLKVGGIVRCPCIAVDENASENIAYIAYDTAKLYELSKILSEELEIENLPIPESINVGDIVFAQSSEDGCWYRAIIESCTSEKIVIFFFDWGLRERIEPANYKHIRYLEFPEVGLSQFPACAMKIKFNSLTIPEVAREFLKCETEGQIKVLAYDVEEDTYTAHVTLI